MSTCFNRSVAPLDHIRATKGSTTREFVVPLITVVVNRTSNVVSGHAPANDTVTFSGCHYSDFLNCHSIVGNAPTSSTGTYSKDLSASVDLGGLDYVYTSWYSASGDQVEREGYAAKIAVTVGSAYVTGTAAPGKAVHAELDTSSHHLKGGGNDVSDWNTGSWSTTFVDTNGAPVYPRSEDIVTGTYAGDPTVTIPATSVTATAATDHVSGHCLTSRPIQVYAYHPTVAGYSYAYTTANGSGNFTVDMSNTNYPSFDLVSHDKLEVRCLTAHGDVIIFNAVVP
jgi:hypothetical protein